MTTRLAAGDTSLLAEMHATTSGLKVLVSTTAAQDLETARRSMGGHGFSDFAGVGRLYADYVPAATCVTFASVSLCKTNHSYATAMRATTLCWTSRSFGPRSRRSTL